MYMKALAILASIIAVARAHCTVYGVQINGVDQGDGRNQYIRSPPSNNPVKDIRSSAMACNVNNRAVGRTLDVKAGDKFTFEWYHDYRNDDIIASSHKGPISVFIAPASSNGQGQVWTKIFQEAYDNNSRQWAVDKLIASRGKHSVYIPDVPAGDYLLRAEIIALHEADVTYSQNQMRGAQFYMSCAQIRVTSNGGQSLSGGVAFPGYYTDQTQGLVWNLWAKPPLDPNNYRAPGPTVWSGSSGGSVSA